MAGGSTELQSGDQVLAILKPGKEHVPRQASLKR
jgi:hypothetical protein